MNKSKYSEKLRDPRWQKKRLEIFQRDNFICQNCKTNASKFDFVNSSIYSKKHYQYLLRSDDYFYEGECMYKEYEEPLQSEIENGEEKEQFTAFNFHIHHKYYVANREPWEYPDDALITLCSYCHEWIHTYRGNYGLYSY
jgi:5-methylcytosine-specific restriction endonuclease McrA